MLIDTTSSETASALLTRLTNLGDCVVTNKSVTSSVAYSANGLILRQREEAETTEFRGLTKTAAEKLLTLNSDTVTSVIYYKQIGGDDYAVVGIQSGSKADWSMHRDQDSSAFTAVRDTSTYGASDAAGWTTTRPSSSQTGLVISTSLKTALVSRQDLGLFSTVKTTAIEYRFLTKAEADALVASQSSSASHATWYYYHPESHVVACWYYLPYGTEKVPSSRYIDAQNGYTVTVNRTDYDAGGTNWRRE